MMGGLGCSGISWAICKQSAHRSRQITTPTPHHSIFTGRMLFLTPNQQCQSTEGNSRKKEHKLTQTHWVVVDSDGSDVSSTNSRESDEAMLPFTNIHNSLIQVQQATNVSSNEWIHTQQQTYVNRHQTIRIQY